MSQFKTEVRVFCKQCENTLTNPKSQDEVANVLCDVAYLVHFFDEEGCLQTELKSIKFSDTRRAAIVFQNSHYNKIGHLLLEQLNTDWVYSHLKIRTNIDAFELIFLQHSSDDGLLLLLKGVTESRFVYNNSFVLTLFMSYRTINTKHNKQSIAVLCAYFS